MAYLFKILLNLAERLEDARGAWRARREAESKTILTFLAQGAAGGMLGYFLMTIGLATQNASVFSFLYCFLLPLVLVVGAAAGAFAGMLVWLAEVLCSRRFGFIGRTVIVSAGLGLLSIAWSYWNRDQLTNAVSTPLLFVFVCAVNLPIVLMIGSGIRPGHALLFGTGRRIPKRTFRARLAIPPGFLLRVISIFALLESLLVLTVWISIRTPNWSDSASREGLTAVVMTIIYFGISTYLSLNTPRKKFLLPLAIALNLSAFLVLTERDVGTFEFDVVVYAFLGFVCLWIAFTCGCLIAPASPARVVKSVNGTYVIKTYSSANV